MHMADALISPAVGGTLWAVSGGLIVFCARKVKQSTRDNLVPLMGILGAFVFAAQMINFPVGFGTSGHLLGSALLVVTLGPAASAVVMTSILVVQALIFQDGGVLALGANVFNMAVAGVLAAYLPYRIWSAGAFRNMAIFLGGFLSVMSVAALAVAELLVSGIRMGTPVLGVSFGLFFVNALLEGAITIAVVKSLESMRPDWVRAPDSSGRTVLASLAAAAILLAVFGVLFASADPDGLEKLAERAGISGHARNLIVAPLADYELQGAGWAWIRKAGAGLVGVAILTVAVLLLGRLIARRKDA